MWHAAYPDLPSDDLQPVLAEEPDRLGKALVFPLKDAVGKGVLVIVIHDRDAVLEDDGAAVKALVHEMHRAPGDFHAVEHRLPLGMQPGKTGRRAGWMFTIFPGNARTISGPRMRM